ncbi:sodium/pantothenate symporter [Desulfotomaculum arcticum]|uniref:Sodium/pantothenate symporter n=1 Tax=Desulfotruncus arcticus DSM 17038 TaxID=1121424 RepID=A0A1I2TKD5_9FIRM|nr:sodium:solute symporter family protein [Desulfotruncus arcticus]SFG63847.1 sodium/pantothenate symporter [Desulfotomaculum arcticum] [Desulfotruncus arcticus DSM 17038]
MNMTVLTAVLIIYLIFLYWFGRMGYKVSKTLSDFVAGGWNMNLMLLIGTFSATWVSAVSIMGFPGMLFGMGLAALTAVYGGYFMANTLMPFLAFKIRRPENPPSTIPEYLRLRFEPHAEKSGLQVLGGLSMVIGYAVYVMIQVSAFGYLFSTITGLPYVVCIFLFGAFILYVAAGGTLSVAISDLFNTAVIVVAVFFGALIIYNQVGGWNVMWDQYSTITAPALAGGENIKEGALLSLLGPYPLSTIIGLFIASAIGGSLAPHWPSRMLYAKNTKTAIALPMVSQLIIAFLVFGCLLIMGVGGRVLVGTLDAKSTDWIMPYLFMNTIPGLLGAVGIAGLLAAAMSTANSMLFHGALALVYDVFRNMSNKHYNDESLRKWSRITVVVLGATSIILAINPPVFIGIVSAKVFGFWAASFFVPLYVGLYWKRLNKQSVYWSMVVAPITYILFDYLITKGLMWGTIPAMVWALLVGVVGGFVLSYVYPSAPKEGWEPFFEPEISAETRRVWADARQEMV